MIFTKLYIRIFKIIVNILSTNKKIQYIGTEYGGWYILKNTEIRDGVILSAGVGEDISFDIEMINLQNSAKYVQIMTTFFNSSLPLEL